MSSWWDAVWLKRKRAIPSGSATRARSFRAGVLQTVALFGVTLPVMGPPATRPTSRPTTAAVLARAAGWLLTRSIGPTLLAGVCGGTLAVVLFVGLLLVLDRPTLKATFSFARSCLRAARESTAGPAAPLASGPDPV
jgi:hypothetical protein